MQNEIAKSGEMVGASIEKPVSSLEKMLAGGVFHVTCYDKDGNLKWEDKAHNLVVNQGLQDMNTKYFTGSTYTAAWYLGLYGAAASNTPAASDTLAVHAGWTEETGYSGNRKAVTFGTATTADPSVITNSASPASFAITATATIGGAFLCNVATGTSGILFSAADFQSPGDRSVVNGDVLNVTYTFSLDAA
jgi:hypothetical protein